LSRSVQCDSGHKFCLSCWRTQLQMKVKEDTVKCLQCPAFKCGIYKAIIILIIIEFC
jgi:hypothetical protein